MQLKQKLRLLVEQLRALPIKYTIPAVIFIVGLIAYGAAFMIDKPVHFSYAGDTCVTRLTLLPSLHSSSSTAGYEAKPSRLVTLGGWPVAARAVCVSATKAPEPGEARVSLAPLGGVVARQTFAVTVSSPVSVNVSPFDTPLPVSRPLELKLSGSDATFSYVLRAAGKQTPCTIKEAKAICDIEKLSLVQSQSYPMQLVRQFNGRDVTVIMAKTIHTLSATTLTASSIKSNEVVYSKPTELSVTADKKLVRAEVTLYKVSDGNRLKVPTSTAVMDTGFIIKWSDELARSAQYELTTSRVEATDGSGLVEPYTIAFTTSGGPKVTGVNVGAIGISSGTTIAVTFDQPLSDKQDMGKFITTTGGASFIARQGSQLLFSVLAVPKCGDFTIKLTGDLQSQYEIAGQSAWNYAGRTICHTIRTIGISAQGRPMNAYYFGSGATAVLYTGAIHGSEMSTKLLMDRWVQDLEEKARSIPSGITVVVVPVINPDGVARGGRTNARNVDLNRNFATSDWQKDITDVNNQPFPGGGGDGAMSEPETKAIAALAQQLQPKVILSYHSIGGMVAANQAGNSSSLAAMYGRLSGYRNVTGQSESTFEYSISGTADDWYAQAIGVSSILVELGSHTAPQFERNQAAMWAMIGS
jgi:predicted deacylase